VTTLSTYIRDQAYNRLTVGSIKDNWRSSRKFPVPTLQSDLLPCLSVYLMQEDLNPDGDDNVSVPRYIADAILGLSIFDETTDPEVIDGNVDVLADLIEETLLTDISFVSLKDSTGAPLIESFPRLSRRYHFPSQGEKYFVECRLQLTVRYRCYFAPPTPTALTSVDVTSTPVPTGAVVPNIIIPLPQ